MSNIDLQQAFTKFIEEVIQNTITDIHIGSGNFPYVRVANRDVQPVEKF